MNDFARDNLTLSLVHQSIAKEYLNWTHGEVTGDSKNFINRLKSRLEANEADTLAKTNSAEKRDHIIKEIKKGDPMLFANLIFLFLKMTVLERATAERLLTAISNGDAIEVTAAEDMDY